MESKRKAAVWDANKQEWTEQEILVAHLVDKKELKKRKRQKIKHFLGNVLSFITECLSFIAKCLCAFLIIIAINFIMDIIGVPSSVSEFIKCVGGTIIGYWLAV